MINMDNVRDKVNKMKDNEYLSMHEYSIWQGENGKWYTYFHDESSKSGRKLVKRKDEQTIKNTIIKYYKEKENQSEETFYECFIKWKGRQKKCGVANSTITHYESDYRRFFGKDDIVPEKQIKTFNETDIENLIFRILDREKIKYQGLRQMFYMLDGIFKQARREKKIIENPCDYIDIETYKKRCLDTTFDPKKRVLNDDECKKVLEIILKDRIEKPEYIPSYALELSLLTGLRAGELSFLQWKHIKYNEGYILVCGSEKYDQATKTYCDDKTKTAKERKIPLTNEMIDFFSKLKKVEMEHGYLTKYVFSDHRGRIHRGTLCTCGRNKCIQAGVEARGLQVARRTFNSQLKTSGVSTVIASSILGHSQEVNEKFYTYDTSNMDYKLGVVENINKKLSVMTKNA